jgi:hypothetical protein
MAKRAKSQVLVEAQQLHHTFAAADPVRRRQIAHYSPGGCEICQCAKFSCFLIASYFRNADDVSINLHTRNVCLFNDSDSHM